MLANVMWQTQEALHGKGGANSVVLPGALVLAASSMVLYRHATGERDEDFGDPMKTFLALICLQMVPLVFLEMRILKCPDPMGMMAKFGGKVLLMHAGFLGLRVLAWLFGPFNGNDLSAALCNVAGFLGALAAFHVGWGFTRPSSEVVVEYAEVLGLTILAFVGAMVTEALDPHSQDHMPHSEAIVFAATSYIEILAFVPAVWMVYRWSKKGDEDVVASKGADVQKQATCFFAFLVALYFVEDVVSAFRVGFDEPLAAAGHLVHYLLTLDFACFLLAHVYNPEKLKSELLRYLPDQLWV